MRGKVILVLALLSLLFRPGAARADEIRLKDGTKIIGTIVGFENNSFRVETSYGFALVRKDMVADINISAPKKDSEPVAKSIEPPPKRAPAVQAVFPTVTRESIPPESDLFDDSLFAPTPRKGTGAPASTVSHETIATSTAPAQPRLALPVSSAKVPAVTSKVEPTVPKAKSVAATAAVTASPPAPTAASSAAAAKPGPAAPPPAPPAPPEIHDEIRGTLYLNYTYGFQIYKPPSWDLIPEARKALPDAVAALGTSDQTTLLVIGRAQAKDSLDGYATTAGKALSGVYENFRLISTRHITIAGLPAVEQRSRGAAGGHDWSVVMLTIVRGPDAFTMLGMTWADSDLIQVQENVISKAVNSLTFVAK